MITKGPCIFIPALHYTMEFAACTHEILKSVHPDCIAVELPETFQELFLHATARLPDISVIIAQRKEKEASCFLIEPCDASLEALRFSQEHKIPSFCIDLDVENYPEHHEALPDGYAIEKIGRQKYYEAYQKYQVQHDVEERELYMAKRLRELSYSYEKIVVVMGMSHIQNVLQHLNDSSYPTFTTPKREVTIATLTPESMREVLAESGWISLQYEQWRATPITRPDRKKWLWDLLKTAKLPYEEKTKSKITISSFRNLWKFCRNYSYLKKRLLPDLYELLVSCKGSVDHNFAYEVWKIATDYPYLTNVDNLEALPLRVEEVWGHAKKIRFHTKQISSKAYQKRLKKDSANIRFFAPNPFSICSYQKEDLAIEAFGNWLKKRGQEHAREEASRTIPFTSSCEDGIDTKETIRHLSQKKLYVKTQGKPAGHAGSVVVIFDEDTQAEEKEQREKYPWLLSWLGEHSQESDMAFYATNIRDNIVGPGISRCEYGGFLMTYPPRRLFNVWEDPDYTALQTKAEVLLAAAIDYAIEPLVVFVAEKKPKEHLKRYAARRGKKIVFFPISQFSKTTLHKLRFFHVLDSYERRKIADDYIHG
jgi:hypothetical protein